ncbi:MAG: peptide-methionine (R)-S-oxide reductase MsrB [Candidatus Heimdallarchaeota archaeon]|nr:MAG: peptide-methionine (R)-S-oxide reductase MsrB [Candidatus Heimdallarchaeota archaeon]
MNPNKKKTEDEWKITLTKEQFWILREKGTERAFSGKYWNHFEEGEYKCAGCGTPLFKSEEKFESSCGWPSFSNPIKDTIEEESDTSHGMIRTEVLCSACGGHLGHLFNDGPKEKGGLRYCINSAAIEFNSVSFHNI